MNKAGTVGWMGFAVLAATLAGCAEAAAQPKEPELERIHEEPHRAAMPARHEPEPLPPYEHTHDVEYQNGLTKMLITAPILGSRLATILYRWGYSTGLAEANFMTASVYSMLTSTACLVGGKVLIDRGQLPAMPTKDGPVAYDEFCTSLQRKHAGYGPQGKMFSAARLEVAQQGAKSAEDPREIEFRDTIFVVGYNMGFAHAWEGIDHEAATAKASIEGCSLAMNVEPRPSPALAHAITDTCAAFAKSQRDSEPVHNLKCLLVGGEMNSDLSGLQFKPGCLSGKKPTAD